jgi:hypothetical protein
MIQTSNMDHLPSSIFNLTIGQVLIDTSLCRDIACVVGMRVSVPISHTPKEDEIYLVTLSGAIKIITAFQKRDGTDFHGWTIADHRLSHNQMQDIPKALSEYRALL